MYLKSIEIQGFKSFANKITFEFHQGITGIVGPNGSGKSNVSDAVRWVLGEQSARQLRGGNMQDVIFAGTELRKPQGFAYVAITLDNSDRKLAIDFDEVKISRRLYRSGESEYMMNGSPCRLRDVNELLFDTGIGQDGYSMIGQGQVEKILNGRSDERRELFDEAVGITKFKKRKALAERKLENERASLVRVSDILAELEKQIGPLKRQSETARTYLRLKEELKKLDISLFFLETDQLTKEQETLREREEILSGDAADAARQAAELKEQYESLNRALEALEEELSGKRERLSAISLESGALSGRIEVLKEQINTERMNEEHISSRLSAVRKEAEERNEALSEYEDSLSAAGLRVHDIEKEKGEAERSLMDADETLMLTEKKISDLKQSVIDLMNERAALTAKDERYDAMREQIGIRRAEIAKRLLKLQTDGDVFRNDKETAERALKDTDARLDVLEAGMEEAENGVKKNAEQAAGLTRILSDAQTRYQAAEVRLESLRNLAERYDGYGMSIRRVMETRDRVGGIHGVVADLITVESAYETAIETALGGKIQNIVTDSEETAKKLIEHLKKNRYGRATFLPLTSIGQGKKWEPGAVLSEPGVIGVASSLVKADPKYAGLLNYLLGRDLVVDNVDNAVRIERKYHYQYRIVTKEGELLSPGGSISGGAFKNSSNLLGRRREIDELKAESEKLLKLSERTDAELKQLKEDGRKLKAELDRLTAEHQEVLLQRTSEALSLKGLMDRERENSDAEADLKSEYALLKDQESELSGERSGFAEEAAALDLKKTEFEQEISDAERGRDRQKAFREELSKKLSETSVLLGTALQNTGFLKENAERIREELERLREEEEALAGGSGDSAARVKAREEEISGAVEKIRLLEEEEKTLREEEQKAGKEKERHAAEQKRYFEQRDEIADRMSALDRDLNRVHSQQEKTDERLEQQTSYMLSEYSLTRETAAQFPRDERTEVPKIRKDIEAHKKDIRALGNVNVNAVEDYRALSERYTFMKTQHDDLRAAEDALVKVIEDLDRGMREQFTKNFALIRKEFNRVFRELFGGGHSDIALKDEADILEADVVITAEPPGKKLQNIMQLSGGEKALTAISLLFAIQSLKPSPFALLDEIEAALDDSNVERFVKYLRRLTEHTQFIVITHRRGTMVGADRLYGITMQEKGISALVSVSLIEDKLDN